MSHVNDDKLSAFTSESALFIDCHIVESCPLTKLAAYPGYTLQMKTLSPGWPIMVHDMHTRRRRLVVIKSEIPNSKLAVLKPWRKMVAILRN